jgi:hypothetical protein
MSLIKKKTVRKSLKKRGNPTTVVVETSISPDETLFPEKVAKAKKVLQNATFTDTRFGSR